MEIHYGPSHFKNSEGSRVDLSMIGKHTPSTLVRTAKLVGRSRIVTSSRIFRPQKEKRTDTVRALMKRV